MGYFNGTDTKIIRELAKEYYEIAFSPFNERSIELAYNANDLKGGRPFVSIEELPWVELKNDPELELFCSDPFARDMEDFFRSELYRYRHFPTNKLFRKFYAVDRSYSCEGGEPDEDAEIIRTEEGNNIVSHRYRDQFEEEADLEKIKPFTVTAEPNDDAENLEKAHELLDGITEVRLTGEGCVYFAPWDKLVRLHTVENTFYDLYDRPDFLHAMMNRYVSVHTDRLLQMENLGLFDSSETLMSLHCTSPLTEYLPGAEKEDCGMKDIWLRLTAQSLGSCSPKMYNEFEIEHNFELTKRFGAVYYGCCEPLDKVIPYLRKIKNLRKIGVSPFADVEVCAEQIGGDYCLSRKPNPSYLSGGFSAEAIRDELLKTIKICEKYGCSYDYVLKDISTVGHHPERLAVWAETVSRTLDEYYGK